MGKDVKDGERLAREFLEKCAAEKITGVGLLNALGNSFVAYFCETKFNNHRDRMDELDRFCAYLRSEVDQAAKDSPHGR